MSAQTYRDRWRREVYWTPLVPDSVRVVLLALAEGMDDDGTVSIRRADLSSVLGKSGRRVGDRLSDAIEAGLLERVARGQRNGPGVYRAVMPESPGAPSWGHPGVPKNPSLLGTPGGPEEDSLGDGIQPQEPERLEDPRGASRGTPSPGFFGTPGGPEEAASPIGNRARALVTGDRPQEPAPSPSETDTDETASPRADMRVSQSASRREAFRWLHGRYGLTEFEAASVIAEVRARAPKPIRSLVPYLAGMKEGDLADIVGAVQNRTAEMTAPAAPDEFEAAPEGDDERPARPAAATEWCGHCDRRTRLLELLDGRPKRCPTCHPLREETA